MVHVQSYLLQLEFLWGDLCNCNWNVIAVVCELLGSHRKPWENTGAQEAAPGHPRRLQEASGSSRKPQDAPGDAREAPGGPGERREPQEMRITVQTCGQLLGDF